MCTGRSIQIQSSCALTVVVGRRERAIQSFCLCVWGKVVEEAERKRASQNYVTIYKKIICTLIPYK